jgi:hypothetical protein
VVTDDLHIAVSMSPDPRARALVVAIGPSEHVAVGQRQYSISLPSAKLGHRRVKDRVKKQG